MEVWIFQTGEPLHIDVGDPRPMRAMNLADALVARGHKVVVWSAAFFHQEKRHRASQESTSVRNGIEFRLIPSIGYKQHIGFARLVDHAQLAWNLRRSLAAEERGPDVAFVGYPPIEFAAVATRWLSRRKIPVLIDGKDQWPDIFIERFPRTLRPLAKAIFMPYAYLGRRAMRESSGLSSMSESFLAWMREFSGREPAEFDGVFPLSSFDEKIPDSAKIEARRFWAERGVAADGRARFFFVGSLSSAFEFDPVIVAADLAQKNNLQWQFVICGDGMLRADLERRFAPFDNVVLPGWINRAQIEALSEISLAGIAPYRNVPNFQANVPNKILDYLKLGQPVVSPLSGEVRRLIESDGVGLEYDELVERSLFDVLRNLEDSKLRDRLSSNARKTFLRDFDGEAVYGRLVEHLATMARRGR